MGAVSILVPVDGSEASAAALRAVVPFAQSTQATCVVMAVAEPRLDGRFEKFAGSEHASIAEVEQSYLDQKAEWLRSQGVQATAYLDATPGVSVPEAIADYAAKNDVDWIAMATHGRSGFGRAVFGSVFQGVLRRSSVPLIAFPEASLTAASASAAATEVP